MIQADCLLKPHFQNILIPALTTPFVVAEHFKEDISAAAPVKIFGIGGNFKKWFGSQTIPVREGYTVQSHILARNSRDEGILAELGEGKETDIAAVYFLMTQQPNGEDGALFTNGWGDIFYCKDVSGILRAVNAHWYGDRWPVRAFLVAYPHPWDGGDRVFSRNS